MRRNATYCASWIKNGSKSFESSFRRGIFFYVADLKIAWVFVCLKKVAWYSGKIWNSLGFCFLSNTAAAVTWRGSSTDRHRAQGPFPGVLIQKRRTLLWNFLFHDNALKMNEESHGDKNVNIQQKFLKSCRFSLFIRICERIIIPPTPGYYKGTMPHPLESTL